MQTQDTTKQIIYVTVVDYFGRVTVKPECEIARQFAKLLGQKTLTPENIEGIKQLGYEVRVAGRSL